MNRSLKFFLGVVALLILFLAYFFSSKHFYLVLIVLCVIAIFLFFFLNKRHSKSIKLVTKTNLGITQAVIEAPRDYTSEEKSILNSAPKYTQEEIIKKYNLQVSLEKPKSEPKQRDELRSIDKNIPKQNLKYKDYASVFKNINKDLKDSKKD